MHEASNMRQRKITIVPVLKLSERMTHPAAIRADTPFIVVKMQELLTPSGNGFSSLYRRVQAAGGLHKYIGSQGIILLSMVMPNRMILNCGPERYAAAIKSLRPDFATTIDGETYEGRIVTSKKECARCLAETKDVMRLCPGLRFFGLVKGASRAQIEEYTGKLLEMGIDTFVLHVGDFICRGKRRARETAIIYARAIRVRVPKLVLYGISSPVHLRRFPPAEAYVTQTHFISAFNGLERRGGKWEKTFQKANSEVIERNLAEITREAREAFAPRGGLLPWVEDNTAAEGRTPATGTA